MSALRKSTRAGSAQTTRLRKVSCPECGYTIRMARSWMSVGLPSCPCGSEMRPESSADLAYCGLIDCEDVSAVEWTAICRENGWTDSIIRRGAAAKAHERHELEAGGFAARRAGAAHCVYPGCGRWIADGAERCTAGHSQHDHGRVDEACPF
jgi:hypothetical protein